MYIKISAKGRHLTHTDKKPEYSDNAKKLTKMFDYTTNVDGQ